MIPGDLASETSEWVSSSIENRMASLKEAQGSGERELQSDLSNSRLSSRALDMNRSAVHDARFMHQSSGP